jgi:F420-dependent methylenetetrahydromethanopterin dehydrogenase
MAGEQAKQEISGVETRDKCLSLRRLGMSYAEVAKQVGLSRGGAYKAVQHALDEIRASYRETAAEVLELELDRLDEMTRALSNKVGYGDPQAVTAALRVMDRRAKLLGLDAPTKIAPTDPSGDNPYLAASDDELRALAVKVAAGVAGGTERTEQL